MQDISVNRKWERTLCLGPEDNLEGESSGWRYDSSMDVLKATWGFIGGVIHRPHKRQSQGKILSDACSGGIVAGRYNLSSYMILNIPV